MPFTQTTSLIDASNWMASPLDFVIFWPEKSSYSSTTSKWNWNKKKKTKNSVVPNVTNYFSKWIVRIAAQEQSRLTVQLIQRATGFCISINNTNNQFSPIFIWNFSHGVAVLGLDCHPKLTVTIEIYRPQQQQKKDGKSSLVYTVEFSELISATAKVLLFLRILVKQSNENELVVWR